MNDDEVNVCVQLIRKIANDKGYFSVKKHGDVGKYIVVSVEADMGFTTKRKLYHFNDFNDDVKRVALTIARKRYNIKIIEGE